MKHARFLIAVATAAAFTLATVEAADAAVRYVRSSGHNDNEEDDDNGTVQRTGNVRRGGNVGNVRSSTRRAVESTPTVSHPSVSSSSPRYSSSSSSTRHSSHSAAQRVSGSSSRGDDDSGRRGGSATYTRRTTSQPRHIETPSPRNMVGNVRSGGNVTGPVRKVGYTYSTNFTPGVNRRQSETRDGRYDRGRARRRVDDHRPGVPSTLGHIYRDGDRYIYVHSGRYGPFWSNGRWHPYQRDRRRVIYYGYWIDPRDRYYVYGLRPPWAEPDFWEEPTTDRDEYEYKVDEAYGDFIPKGQIHDAVIVRDLSLSTTETRRFQTLILRGIVRKVLEQGSQAGDSDYEFDAHRGQLRLIAPSERIAMIETMVRDRRTFEAVTELNRYGHSATVIAVVSPIYLDNDFRGGVQLATDNFDMLRRMLTDRDWRYENREKACWLNAEYGTATIVDDGEGLKQASSLMERLPFVPRDLVHP